MDRPDIADMTAFVAVAERRSFAKAALHLGVSRSTLSETIRRLEERLDVRLLNRTTRSVALTEIGERLLARLLPVLDDFAAAVESINAFRDRPSGSLRLTVPPPAAASVLAPVLARFLAAYPEIRLEISVDDALVDVVAGRYDAGIRPGERVERDMIAVRISDELRSKVVAAPSYLARHPAPKTPRDLTRHNCIRIRFQSGLILPWRFAHKGKDLEIAVAGNLVVNDSDLALRACLDGAGICYLLADHAAAPIAEGRLVELLPDWPSSHSEGFYLYYPSRRQTPAPLQALIDFLRANLKAKGR